MLEIRLRMIVCVAIEYYQSLNFPELAQEDICHCCVQVEDCWVSTSKDTKAQQVNVFYIKGRITGCNW